MTRRRLILFFTTIVVVFSLAYLVSLYARGYRFDSKENKFSPRGLLVTKSNPDGAQIYLDGELKGATNSNLSPAPGIYDVAIKKEGYHTWQKRLTIEKEVVTEADAYLFRLIPSLSPITFAGVLNPLQSDDLTKIIFAVPSTAETISQEKDGLWLIETLNLPIGFAKDPRRITDGDFKEADWQFSPDNRQILLFTAGGKYLLDLDTFTPQAKRVNINLSYEKLLLGWQEEEDKRLKSLMKNLPEELLSILTEKATKISFSPDENKLLYQAKGEAVIAKNLIKALPGASTQKEARQISSGNCYVYDIKEDRNFLVASDQDQKPVWLPTSKHLLIAHNDEIIIMDYDATNLQDIYSGSYVAPSAFPTANSDRIIILTNLGANSSPANLYSLGLK